MKSPKWLSTRIGIKTVLMIVDFKWWTDNETELNEWMDKNLSNGRNARQGMTIEFTDDKELMLFELRWG